MEDVKPDIRSGKTRVTVIGTVKASFRSSPGTSLSQFCRFYLKNCALVSARFTYGGQLVHDGMKVGYSAVTITVSQEVKVKLDYSSPVCVYLLKSSDGRYEVSVSFPANTPFFVIAAHYYSITKVSVNSFKLMFEGRELPRESCPEVEGLHDGDQIDIVGGERRG